MLEVFYSPHFLALAFVGFEFWREKSTFSLHARHFETTTGFAYLQQLLATCLQQ